MVFDGHDERLKFFLSASMVFAVVFFFLIQHLSVHGLEYRDDEIFYYQSIQEMIRNSNWLSPTYYGENRFQKPILFYWFVIASSLAGGVGWFSARLVSVFFAALTVTLTWILARPMFRNRVALLSCLILATFPMFFRHAKNVVPDMTLHFFIVAALVAAWKWIAQPERRIFRNLFFLACALGFMVKGFAAIVVPFLTVILFALFAKRGELLRRINFRSGCVLMLVIILPWFMYMGFIHGRQYVDLMVRQETLHRLVNPEQPNLVLQFLRTFKANLVFYTGVLATHFAPWSLFVPAALPFAFMRIHRQRDFREPLIFLMIWFGVVFFFFTFIFFRINHYLLILSAPLATLLAFFFSENPLWRGRVSRRIIKGIFIALFILGFLSLALVFVCLAGLASVWLFLYGLAMIVIAIMITRTDNPSLPPALLGLFLVFTLFQSDVISRSGLCPHTVYHHLARLMQAPQYDQYMINVASHNLHEKELQVYFDRRVIKTGHGYEPLTRSNLLKFLNEHEKAFVIITAADYERYADDLKPFHLEPVICESISRKSYALDAGFLRALGRLDRDRIRDYIMQPILLIKKDRHV